MRLPATRPIRVTLTLALCALGLGILAPAAGADGISPPTGHSPNADDANTLYWIALVVTAAIAVAINLALIAAVIRFRARRGEATPRVRAGGRIESRVAMALAVPAVALFVVGVISNERTLDVEPSGERGLGAEHSRTAQIGIREPAPSEDAEVLPIKVIGQQWLWRFEYPGGEPGSQTYSYNELVVPVDTTVLLDIDSTDVVHRWWIPELGGKFDAVPGRTNRTWFRADEEGVYRGSSAAFSGPGYPAMRAQVKVVDVPAYEAWLEQQQTELQEAQAAVQSQAAETTPGTEEQ